MIRNINKNIFVSQKEMQNINNSSDLCKKLTLTNVIEIIPKGSIKKPLDNWRNLKNTEWRWRIMKFSNKITVEISCCHKKDNIRKYFNKEGKWLIREIPSLYDEYVIDQYYYYTN